MPMNQAAPTHPCSPEYHRHSDRSLLEETMSPVMLPEMLLPELGMELTRSVRGSRGMSPESDPPVPELATSPEY